MENSITILITIITLILFISSMYLLSNPTKKITGGVTSGILSFIIPALISVFMNGVFLNIIAIIYFILFAIIIIQGLLFVSNDPISVAVITKYGAIDWLKTKNKDGSEKTIIVTKKHGLRFIFLRGIMYDAKIIVVKRINIDLPEQEIITPDNAVNYLPSQYTFTPGPNYLQYIINGGEEGVKNILNDQIAEKQRIWGSSKTEGPKTWQDMRGAGDEAISLLIKSIAGEDLTPIPSEIPTWKLFQYYKKVSFYPSEDEIKEMQKIREEIEKLSPEEEKKLKKAIDERWDLVKKVRHGNGTQKIDTLGITLNRYNIGKIRVNEKLEEALQKRTVEKAEAEAEKIELDNIKIRIFELMFEHNEEGKPKTGTDGKYIRTGISEQAAIELIQSERGKVPKKISVERKELSLDKVTLEMISTLAVAVVESLKNGGKK